MFKDILFLLPYFIAMFIYMISITIIYFILFLPASLIFIINNGNKLWQKKIQH